MEAGQGVEVVPEVEEEPALLHLMELREGAVVEGPQVWRSEPEEGEEAGRPGWVEGVVERPCPVDWVEEVEVPRQELWREGEEEEHHALWPEEVEEGRSHGEEEEEGGHL